MIDRDRRRPPVRKRFGQHFLERAWADKVVAAIDPAADQVFVEIGPGRGAITWPLVERGRHVLACEVDRDLAAALREAAQPKLTVLEGDVLDLAPEHLGEALDALPLAGSAPGPVRLAGNLPYNLASPILFKCLEFVEAGIPIQDAVVMLQREVADRILALPGRGEYGVLSILLGQVADVERLLTLPAGAFRPAPQVQSALIRLRWHRPEPAPRDLAAFRRLVRSVFTRRRKTLSNALAAFGILDSRQAAALVTAAGLDPRQRPETLTIPDFVRLADAAGAAAAR